MTASVEREAVSGGGEPINLAQINGTTVSAGSGVADAGTLRVVPAANVATWRTGQAVIAVTATAVQLSATDQVLQNGIILTAWSGNNANAGRTGTSGVTFNSAAPVGTGNGYVLAPGASVGIPSGVNLNTIYVNGTAGDVFSFSGS